MKKTTFILIFLSFITCFTSCSDDMTDYVGDKADDRLSSNIPTDLKNVRATPIVGGVMIKWDIPTDTNYTYIEVNYQKNGKPVKQLISKYTDSIKIDGLINKEPTEFSVRSIIEKNGKKYTSDKFNTEPITPIKREPDIEYLPDGDTEIDITADMLTTFTQEPSEGPKENLVDGDPNTYWHSAWSANTAPLPHWIQIDFDETQEVGIIKYYLRNPSATSGRPKQIGLEVSNDTESWEEVWRSEDDLDIDSVEAEHTLLLDKNYESMHFRVTILKTEGDTEFTHLGELALSKLKTEVIDKEKEAEEEYYNF